MDNDMQLSLSSIDPPLLSEVGGKAASLIRLSQNGFNVPGGIVLTTDYFAPWIDEVERSLQWQTTVAKLLASATRLPGLDDRARLAETCDAIKQSAGQLPFSAKQKTVLDQLVGAAAPAVYAVRSSSPEEDLVGASFAGQYESVLNVAPENLESAVRACFLSCLDARVLLYKRQMNFKNLTPSIAVIVQQQVDSEISGVAFSLNPLTNDFDEALINASWGLGEALVSGEVTPDRIVVDKVSGEIIEQRPGDKGGVRSEEVCLDSARIARLTEALSNIESLYGEPVDVEWAIASVDASDELTILQARPITAYIPLAPELQTGPGAQRYLYMDGALTDGLTISGPISPITLDVMERLYRLMFGYMFNLEPAAIDMKAAGMPFGGSRFYLNLSYVLHLTGHGDFLAKQVETTNTMVADIFRAVDLKRYRLAQPPAHLTIWNVIKHLPGIVWHTREFIKWGLKPLRQEKFLINYERELRDFESWVDQPIDHAEPFSHSMTDWYTQVALTSLRSTGPALLYFMYGGTDRVKRLIDIKSTEQVALADALCRGYPDDQIVQMGLQMYDLAQLLSVEDAQELPDLLERLNNRQLPEAFLSRWDAFIDVYGCRGPLEMELENPGYGEEPMLALQQIASIALTGTSSNFNPHQNQRQLIAARESAYQKLMSILPPRKRKRLARAYKNILTYSGSRELIKHHLMQVNEKLRQRLLHLADRFISDGRLDAVSQVFELKMGELDRALKDPGYDLRAAAAMHGPPYRKLKAQLRHFPMMIDSRGRIMRPEAKSADGALKGTGVSPGVVTGPVKVLNDPFEKEVLAGEILVAVTTDPGWTPLFINAGALLLEIGGELQHGALVAREYGKPCVTGIADITTILKDGQVVEVDGNSGLVRVLD